MVHQIKDKEDLDSKFAEAGGNLVVLDFSAAWCGPCKMIAPKLDDLVKEFPNVLILKIDVDECEEIAMEYGIKSMPTFIFLKNGQEITQFSGANYEKLKETIEANK
ncbi:thioredoxin-2-like [Diorhabda carinulata]|uniref:thioredoxin-2-like n=1 Tax=Diorhabda sublineata TaxID=1163346 RepID=UPI0024E1629F|nr:thioredoxin-2-like [Diorhabda sublineata]XP_057658430.1 thioredoxin-2-like [Diorhabda carinulata]